MADPGSVGLQFRLVDDYGDNGVVAIAVGHRRLRELWLDSWLMSCRVLGREVETATLQVIVAAARRMACEAIIGEYIPTAANALVSGLYPRLGFKPSAKPNRFVLELDAYRPSEPILSIEEA